jgi:hypothetical protein
MRCGSLVVLLGVLLGQIAIGGRARAAPAAPAPAPAPAPAAPPATTAPATQYPPGTSPWEMPPGTYHPPPAQHPGYGPQQPVPNLHWAIANYESSKRSRALALVIEWFIPGGGSIYGDHLQGAVITWVTMVAGVALLVWGVTGSTDYAAETENEDRIRFGVGGGIVLLLGGRTYGFIDAWQSTTRYNENLRARFGVPPQYGRDVHGPGGPRRIVGPRTFGPQLAFRF